jgi:hypothetical protein
MLGLDLGLIAFLASGVGLRERAQPQAAAAGGSPVGSVTGHVIAQDTQRVVRFAGVLLQSVAAVAAEDGAGGDRFGGGGAVNSRTDAEGDFTAVNVAPGDYYVTATAPGYVSERALLQAAVNAGASPAALLAQIPVVHVAADSTASVVVTIERGATISGRVQWEDGSPASGLALRAIPPAAPNGTANGAGPLPGVLQGIQSAGGSMSFGQTDDRGGFRIAGLPAGNYLVQATVPTSSQSRGAGNVQRFNSPVMVYSPGVFRRAEAKAVSVNAGEERTDVRMVIDLRGLHTVSGHVTSSDPSLSVASGRVTLTDANDRDLHPVGSIVPDGGFVLRYVPPGTYTLQVSGASTQIGGGRGRGNQGAGVSFQPGTQTVTVTDGDITDVAISLTPAQSSQ